MSDTIVEVASAPVAAAMETVAERAVREWTQQSTVLEESKVPTYAHLYIIRNGGDLQDATVGHFLANPQEAHAYVHASDGLTSVEFLVIDGRDRDKFAEVLQQSLSAEFWKCWEDWLATLPAS